MHINVKAVTSSFNSTAVFPSLSSLSLRMRVGGHVPPGTNVHTMPQAHTLNVQRVLTSYLENYQGCSFYCR